MKSIALKLVAAAVMMVTAMTSVAQARSLDEIISSG